MMETTLVQALRSIDQIPDFVEVDKQRETIRVLDTWRRQHPMMDKALRGEVSIYNLVEEVTRRYHGIKLFLPIFRTKQEERALEELHLDDLLIPGEVVTPKSRLIPQDNQYYKRALYWINEKVMNPPVLGVFMGAFVALTLGGHGRFESSIANYSVAFGIGAVTGTCVGLLTSLMKHQELNIARNSARYLDARIHEVSVIK